MGDFGLGFVDKEIEFDTADFSETRCEGLSALNVYVQCCVCNIARRYWAHLDRKHLECFDGSHWKPNNALGLKTYQIQAFRKETTNEI